MYHTLPALERSRPFGADRRRTESVFSPSKANETKKNRLRSRAKLRQQWQQFSFCGNERYAFRLLSFQIPDIGGHVLLLRFDVHRKRYEVYDPAEHGVLRVQYRMRRNQRLKTWTFESFSDLMNFVLPVWGEWRLDSNHREQRLPLQTEFEAQRASDLPMREDLRSGFCGVVCVFMLAFVLRFNLSDVWEAGTVASTYIRQHLDQIYQRKIFVNNVLQWIQRIANAKGWVEVFHALGLTPKDPPAVPCGVFDDSGFRMCAEPPCPGFALCVAHKWRLITADPSAPLVHVRPVTDRLPHLNDDGPVFPSDEVWLDAEFLKKRARGRSNPYEIEDDPPRPKRACVRTVQNMDALLKQFDRYLQENPYQFYLIYRAKMSDRAHYVCWDRLTSQHNLIQQRDYGLCTVTEGGDNDALKVRDISLTDVGPHRSSRTFRRERRYIRALMFLTGMYWKKQKAVHVLRFCQDVLQLCDLPPEFKECEYLECAEFDGLDQGSVLRWHRDVMNAFVCTERVLPQITMAALRFGRADANVVYECSGMIVGADMKMILDTLGRAMKAEMETLLLPLYDGGDHAAIALQNKNKLTLWTQPSGGCAHDVWNERIKTIRSFYPTLSVHQRSLWLDGDDPSGLSTTSLGSECRFATKQQ